MNVNILDISINLYKTLFERASNNVYDTSAPKNMKDDNFIVYRVDGMAEVHDFDTGEAFRCFAVITCYHKDKANGVKNVAGLKTMLDNTKQALENYLPYRMSFSSYRIQDKELDNYHGQTIIINIKN